MKVTPKILCIVGPTAVGKTDLAVTLAKKFDGELVSADSRQVYTGMDIGTGKDIPLSGRDSKNTPTISAAYRGKTCTLPSHLIDGVLIWMTDVTTPDKPFSVDAYADLSWQVINDIWKRGHLPVVVGGTGFYLSSLLHPIETSSVPPDEAFRKDAQTLPVVQLQKMLSQIAPEVLSSLNLSDRNNPRRLMRKIEIARMNCRTAKKNHIVDSLVIGLTAPVNELYSRIDKRVEKRILEGVENEVRGLIEKGYTFSSVLGTTPGYKEWESVLRGEKTGRAGVISRWKYDEHGYARRQMTWFRKMKEIQWFDVTVPQWKEKVLAITVPWYT